jgi:WD repeat and SOF domain-containing protein 1
MPPVVKTVHHRAELRSTGDEMPRLHRNPDPTLHAFGREREYLRALNAVKLDKMFAKPFVKALDQHYESVKVLKRSNNKNATLYSGACDGEVIYWNMSRSEVVDRWKAHSGFVRGIVESVDGKYLYTAGDDKYIQQWCLDGSSPISVTRNTFRSPSMILSLDHHWSRPLLVSTGATVDVWDPTRSTPISSFEWGCDMVCTARFNPAEPSLIGATAGDRSVSLYDLRGRSAIRKVKLNMRSNALAWNPQDPNKFTVANENGNLYTFDMRDLKHACFVHADHTMAVLDIDYSPNGQEFCTASYDKTVRIFARDGLKSRDVYYTKRMQRVLSCQYSSDGHFIFTGSEDHNVRVWKNEASKKMGPISERERKAVAYRDELKQKYGSTKEVHRIARHRHLPKALKLETERIRTKAQTKKRKEDNVRKHSKPGKVPYVNQRKQMILEEIA